MTLHHPCDCRAACAAADGELAAPVDRALRRHMQSCRACSIALREARQISALMLDVGYHQMPRASRAAILARVQAEASAHPVRHQAARPRAIRMWLGAASVTVCVALAGLVGQSIVGEPSVPDQAVRAHVERQRTPQQVGILSSDGREIGRWLHREVAFSPFAQDFSQDGFPLVGARIQTLGGEPRPVLVYGHAGDFIDVFVLPDRSLDHAPISIRRDGYTLTSWACRSMSWWAVSQSGEAVQETLAQLVIQAAAEKQDLP